MIIWSIPWIKFWHYQIKFFWYLNSFFILWFQYFDQNNSLAVKYFRYFRYLLVTRALLIRLSVVFFSFYERCWIFLSPRHSVIRFWQNVPNFGPPSPPIPLSLVWTCLILVAPSPLERSKLYFQFVLRWRSITFTKCKAN